jgi:ketosteroid isomerase-like protein
MKLSNVLFIGVAAMYVLPAIAAGDDPLAALNRKYESAVSSQDAKGWASLFAKDAVLIPAGIIIKGQEKQENIAIVKGQENIQKWGESAVKIWNKLSITEQEPHISGSLAWQANTWEANINAPDRKTMDISGKGLMIVQKEGQDWKIIAFTWNVDPPPSPPL